MYGMSDVVREHASAAVKLDRAVTEARRALKKIDSAKTLEEAKELALRSQLKITQILREEEKT